MRHFFWDVPTPTSCLARKKALTSPRMVSVGIEFMLYTILLQNFLAVVHFIFLLSINIFTTFSSRALVMITQYHVRSHVVCNNINHCGYIDIAFNEIATFLQIKSVFRPVVCRPLGSMAVCWGSMTWLQKINSDLLQICRHNYCCHFIIKKRGHIYSVWLTFWAAGQKDTKTEAIASTVVNHKQFSPRPWILKKAARTGKTKQHHWKHTEYLVFCSVVFTNKLRMEYVICLQTVTNWMPEQSILMFDTIIIMCSWTAVLLTWYTAKLTLWLQTHSLSLYRDQNLKN